MPLKDYKVPTKYEELLTKRSLVVELDISTIPIVREDIRGINIRYFNPDERQEYEEEVPYKVLRIDRI